MAFSASIIFLLQDVPQLYGAERVTLELIRGLSERVPVRLWLIGEERLGEGVGAMTTAAAEMGIATERFAVTGRFSRSLIRELRTRLRTIKSPILHTVGYKAHIHALVAARKLAKTVTTIHGWLVRPELKERFYEWLEVRALRHDDAVVCLTSFYEQQLLAAGVCPERLHHISTGLCPDQLPALEEAERWPDSPFTIALIGRLSWEKNHDLLLRAAVRLRESGQRFRILLAGEGPERANIEANVEVLNLSDCVQLLGYVPMAPLLPSVHCVALCSRIENLPLSLLESMAWGRPVVATSVGGVPDVVAEGETGFLVSDNDDAALADRLQRLMQNHELAQSLGRAGRKRVETEFAFARCIDRHLALYTALTE
ncbi:MAG: glycosyltransferase [Kiritimatiellae bacterium]|nr:glycosyltransferase [Kiritimatiellia bacterium]